MTAVAAAPAAAPVAPAPRLGLGQLFGAELERLRRRRMAQTLVAIFFVGLVGVSAIGYFTHDTDIPKARAEAQQRYEDAFRQFDAEAVDMRARGVPEEEIPPPMKFAGPDELFQDPRYRAVEELPNVVTGTAVAWALFACMIGATLAGAEWAHKTMVALLFWEPRRLRVIGVKLAALFTGVAATGVAASALAVGLGALTARWRGTFDGVDEVAGGFWTPLVASAGRGALLGLMAAAIGFAVANLVRHTAAVLGSHSCTSRSWKARSPACAQPGSLTSSSPTSAPS
jgi:hypothetical protein